MNTIELYCVECTSSFGGDSRTVNFYCMAVNRGNAMEQAEADEDPELGGYLYGEPETGEPCSFKEMAADIVSVPGLKVIPFPEGNWAATDEAICALLTWLADSLPCTQTLGLFAEAA